MSVYTHVPHPHIAERKKQLPVSIKAVYKRKRRIDRFNSWLAVKITDGVGSMWCAYAFAALTLVSLPAAIAGGVATLISWVAQTFLQLVLLSIIMVGQRVAGEAADHRAVATYKDAEAVLHEALQIQEHLAAQDRLLVQLTGGNSDVSPTSSK